MRSFQGAILLACVIAGGAIAPSRETSARVTSVAMPAVVRSANLFGQLEVCEVPGVQEHLLAKGTKTLIYAGEFSHTRVTPWTAGNARIFLYVISGTALIRIGDTRTEAGPGDFLTIPKGARHAVSAKSAKVRAIYFEDRT